MTAILHHLHNSYWYAVSSIVNLVKKSLQNIFVQIITRKNTRRGRCTNKEHGNQ